MSDRNAASGKRHCPCGDDLEPGFAYCSDDCVPADIGVPKDPWADVMPT